MDVAQPVHERAVRNCPWSAALWHSYLRQLERVHAPQEQVIGMACVFVLNLQIYRM